MKTSFPSQAEECEMKDSITAVNIVGPRRYQNKGIERL
jgi:hypothetical protein